MVRKNSVRGLLAVLVLVIVVFATGVMVQAQAAEHPYLGVRLEDTSAGVVVRDVVVGSPAAAAGLKVGDIISQINNQKITHVYQVEQTIVTAKASDYLALTVTSAGKSMDLSAKLGTITDEKAANLPVTTPFSTFGYNNTDKSWMIYTLADNNPFYAQGLRTGDTITMFDGKAYNPVDLANYRDALKADADIKIVAQHTGKAMDITVKASALKAFDLYGYNGEQGMLFATTAPASMTQPSPMSQPNAWQFNAFGYDAANKSWNVFAIDASGAVATAGLHVGDQIMQIDGKTYTPADLRTFRQTLADSASLKLTVMRAGKSTDVTVPATALKSMNLFDNNGSGILFMVSNPHSMNWLGVDFEMLTADMAKAHKISQNDGALITEVLTKSPAETAGLKLNDVITAIGSTTVTAKNPLEQLLTMHKPSEELTLKVLRDGKDIDVKAQLATPEYSGQIPFLMQPF
ncbi:MAG: PDZ domain-containing protein [Anaerolineae bacterium]